MPGGPHMHSNIQSDKNAVAKRIDVDDGYIELVDYMGAGDLAVVNAARVSFGKRKTEMDDGDVKLIRYLAQHKHMSPFRHLQLTFVIHTSEVVCRQLYKHQVGCAFSSGEFREAATVWNEISGRYVEFPNEFHQISKFRKQHKSNKQASQADSLVDDNQKAREVYDRSIRESYKAYEELLALGVCKEQARFVLPVGFMNTLTWTASLEAVVNFIKLRDHDGAQLEIRKLAQAMHTLVKPLAPASVAALLGDVVA
ncbi:MAG: FAD-dependent thymidylate synthase [Proteobacteria bacterium]|nr:FAD-dependent thymidylate synthase [Pseudomonadota bacterium]